MVACLKECDDKWVIQITWILVLMNGCDIKGTRYKECNDRLEQSLKSYKLTDCVCFRGGLWNTKYVGRGSLKIENQLLQWIRRFFFFFFISLMFQLSQCNAG